VGLLTAEHPTVAERIREQLPGLAPAERRVARAVLAGYPMAGLDTVATLAEQAGTSAPTVLRLLGKLGFEGYPDFQRSLRAELTARLSGPAQLYPQQLYPAGGDLARGDLAGGDSAGGDSAGPGGPARSDRSRFGTAVAAAVASSLDELPDATLDRAASLLADLRRPVFVVGGRWSGLLAQFLLLHLRLLRPGVQFIGPDPGERAGVLLDLNRRAVVVAFDYRRYQRDTVAFGRASMRLGAEVILFTDHLLSPLAADAQLVITTEIEVRGSPFTVLTPAMGAVELLVATLITALGRGPQERLARHDLLSAEVLEDR
jgi:DNA-binding MurR/RpiR family transcriptional regulator